MAISQSHFRFGVAELTEATHGWLAAEDANAVLPPGRPFLLRFAVQETAGVAAANLAIEFQYRHNAGAWLPITTTSAVVRTGVTAVFTNGQNCTKRLSGTGTFESTGAGCTHDGTSGGAANDVAANGNSETLIGLQIINADTAAGDVIEFRLTRGGAVLLDAYDVTPRVAVATEIFPVAIRHPGVLGPAERTVPAGAAGKQWLVVTDIAQADLDNPAVAFTLRMYWQHDDGLTWPTPDWSGDDETNRYNGCKFTGGPNQVRGNPTTPPGWTQAGDAVAGRNVRFYLDNTGVAFPAGLLAVPV